MTATSDGTVLLVNVHVGGIPRSTDGGTTWHPTIDIDHDVHDVCAHPTRPGLVAAAAARGLGVSRDGGATWTVEVEGLHASYFQLSSCADTRVSLR
jgi:Neuraminidase (sialidase)